MKIVKNVTYEAALELALPYFCDFYDLHDEVMAKKAEKGADWREFKYRELEGLASGCCCAMEIVEAIFEASEERVHEDLQALRARRG